MGRQALTEVSTLGGFLSAEEPDLAIFKKIEFLKIG